MKDILLEFDGSNVQQARYTHGAGIDEPLIMERGGVSSFYHADGLGSIVDLTDNLGAVAQSYVYDSFGNIVAETGSLTNPYTYTGREFDPESGLYYYRSRYYEPLIGRFLQQDPLGFVDTLNIYEYVFNNPINFIDPFGEQTLSEPLILVTIVAAAILVAGASICAINTQREPISFPVLQSSSKKEKKKENKKRNREQTKGDAQDLSDKIDEIKDVYPDQPAGKTKQRLKEKLKNEAKDASTD